MFAGGSNVIIKENDGASLIRRQGVDLDRHPVRHPARHLARPEGGISHETGFDFEGRGNEFICSVSAVPYVDEGPQGAGFNDRLVEGLMENPARRPTPYFSPLLPDDEIVLLS